MAGAAAEDIIADGGHLDEGAHGRLQHAAGEQQAGLTPGPAHQLQPHWHALHKPQPVVSHHRSFIIIIIIIIIIITPSPTPIRSPSSGTHE
jgi:hypothetical protein